MKKRATLYFLISISLILACTGLSVGQDFPEPLDPPRLVNDYTGLLSEQEFRMLENKLERYEDTTSTQIAVVIINTTGIYDISQYSIELGEKWGVGKKGKDNGILVLAAMQDRDVFISTGYGLEGAIPDVAIRRIIQNYIVPNFRNQEYFKGLDEGTSIMMGLAAGEFTAEEFAGNRGGERSSRRGGLIPFLFPLLLFAFISFMRYRRMARYHYGHDAGFWAILALMMSSGGHRSGSGWNNFSGGSGTFGGGGGGGFGGFGGGSFGGGGAGGSW